jgi:hypothetical protein
MRAEPDPNEMTSTQLYDRAAGLLIRSFEETDPSRREALKREARRFKKLGERHEVEERRRRG